MVYRFNRLENALGPGRKKDAGALARQKQAGGVPWKEYRLSSKKNTTIASERGCFSTSKKERRFTGQEEEGKDPLNFGFVDAAARPPTFLVAIFFSRFVSLAVPRPPIGPEVKQAFANQV